MTSWFCSCRPSVLTAAGGANAVNADGVQGAAAGGGDSKPPQSAVAGAGKTKAAAAAKDKKRSGLKRL